MRDQQPGRLRGPRPEGRSDRDRGPPNYFMSLRQGRGHLSVKTEHVTEYLPVVPRYTRRNSQAASAWS